MTSFGLDPILTAGCGEKVLVSVKPLE